MKKKESPPEVRVIASKEEMDSSLASDIRRVIKFHREATEVRQVQAASKRGNIPLTESLESIVPQISMKVQEKMTAEDCINLIRGMASNDPNRVISCNYFRLWSGIKESTWRRHFGSFLEYKCEAQITLSRGQRRFNNQLAKHASADVYRAISEERRSYGNKYLKDREGPWKTILAFSDVHDIDCDPFALRVLLETAKTAGHVITDVCSAGDFFDCPEFSRWDQDPREWGLDRRVRFGQDRIIRPLRQACPKANFWWLEGNHEARMLRHLADSSPAMRAFLSDLHGMTIAKLFQLDEFEINYIARCDLAALSWRKKDHDEEVARNYKVFYDCCVAHHYTDEGKRMGMPGFSGHIHRRQVWQMYSPTYGPYEWQQLAGMHVRQASYTDGQRWANGFALVHIHVPTKSVKFEYVDIGDFAMAAGKWYERKPEENLVSP